MSRLVPRLSMIPKLPPLALTSRLEPRRMYPPLISSTSNSEHLCGKSSYLDSAAFVKAKINNAGILALGKR